MKFSLRASVLAFLVSLAESLIAQVPDSLQIPDSIRGYELSEVVVSANRHGTIQLRTPEPVRSLGNISLQNYQTRTASETLLLTPGVFVQKTNHGGGSPFLRGLTGNQTLLLIDGIRLSNATTRYGPNQYFNTIDVFSIERMEVLRGSGSVQYGSDAIGGTIQAFSHELKPFDSPLWSSELLTRVATQGMEKTLNGAINYSSKKASLRAAVTRRNFGDIVGGDTTGRQSPTGYDELNFDLKGNVWISPKSALTLNYQSVNQSDVPVYHKIALENYAINKMDPQKRELVYVRLNQNLEAGIFKSAIVTSAFQHTKEGRELLRNGSDNLRNETDEVRTFSASAELFAKSPKFWSANSGIEIYNDHINSSRTDKKLSTEETTSARGLYPDNATMMSIAAFSIHTLDLKKWILNAEARFNYFAINVYDENSGHVTLKPSALVGNISVLRKLNMISSLFLSANTGFRAPNIDDLGTLGIVDFRYESPNYDLKPEHSFQVQLGYKYRSPVLRGEAYIYQNKLYDLIVRNKIPDTMIEGYPVYMKENTEQAYIRGLETAWDMELSKFWSITGNITYTFGQNITKNEPVRRIPPLFGRQSVEYSNNSWWIGLEWQAAARQDRLAAGDKDDNRIPVGGTPGWNIFNINASKTIRFAKIELSLLNLFNQDYRFHGSGVNGYGRSAFLSIIINLGKKQVS